MNKSAHAKQGGISCTRCGFTGHVIETGKTGRTTTAFDYEPRHCPRCGTDFTKDKQ